MYSYPQLSNAQGWVQKWQVSHLDEKFIGSERVYPAGVLKGDTDGDGLPEIIAYDYGQFVVHDGLTGSVEVEIIISNLSGDPRINVEPLVSDIDNDGRDEIVIIASSSTIAYEFVGSNVGINEPEQSNIPKSSELFQNYPNPFNPETKIEYSIKQSGPVEILIFNQLGQKVRTLINKSVVQTGDYSVTWDGKGDDSKPLASGNYYYQIRTGDFVSTKKAILLK